MLQEEATEPVFRLVADPTTGAGPLVSRPTWFVCDFCGEPCGPIVRFDAIPSRLLTRPRIWTGACLGRSGVLAAVEEVWTVELDPTRVRRPNGRFGWGWADRRVVSEGLLFPLSQTEVVVYLFVCLVADRHGMSWYGPRSVSRLIKHPPDAIREALASLARRNLIAIAGRFVQVLDVEAVTSESTESTVAPVQGPTHSLAATTADELPAREQLARLPHQQKEEILRQARQQMARFLGSKEPSNSVLEAVAAGLLRQREG